METFKDLVMVKEEDYTQETDWRANLYNTDVYLFVLDNKVLGEAVLFREPGKFLTVDNIEVRYKQKGIGVIAVKRILEYAINLGYGGIRGESNDEAMPFWNKLGAVLEFNDYYDDCEDCDDDCNECEYCEIDEDELVPFTLYASSFDLFYSNYLK